MSIENVKIYLKNYKKDGEVREFASSESIVDIDERRHIHGKK